MFSPQSLRCFAAALAVEAALHHSLDLFGIRRLIGYCEKRVPRAGYNLPIEFLRRFRSCVRESKHGTPFLQFSSVANIQDDVSGDFFPQPQILRSEIKER